MLGRTEARTRDRMYCQIIRTVRDISRDDRVKNCDMQFANTDRLKENYGIDYSIYGIHVLACFRFSHGLLACGRMPICTS